jgi:endonuclease/exonuclease/phosphatase (EEP) superfamily protein YafD
MRCIAILSFASLTAVLLGMLGRYSWPLDLFSHFRLHYVAALALSAVALLVLREWQSAGFAMVAAVLVGLPAIDYLPSQPVAVREQTLKAISLNVWFRNPDLSAAVSYLESVGADVVALQEISEERALSIAPMMKSYPHVYANSAASTDSVLFSKWPLLSVTTEKLSPDGVSAIRAVIDWQGTPVTVIASHLHWPAGGGSSRRRNAELVGLARMTQPLDEPLIMLGDFNITPWSPNFNSLADAFGLDDCTLGHGFNPTWPSPLLFAGIRIDHCFATSHWETVKVWTGPSIGSDHRPMGVEMQLREDVMR